MKEVETYVPTLLFIVNAGVRWNPYLWPQEQEQGQGGMSGLKGRAWFAKAGRHAGQKAIECCCFYLLCTAAVSGI